MRGRGAVVWRERVVEREKQKEGRERGNKIDKDMCVCKYSYLCSGLFTDGHMSYELDRDEVEEPSLAEMTRTAIEVLDNNDQGFFLLVEGQGVAYMNWSEQREGFRSVMDNVLGPHTKEPGFQSRLVQVWILCHSLE